MRLPEAGTARVVARVVDARGHPVLGQALAWRSGDPSVAAVDSLARLTAVTAGRTVVVAASGDLSAELPLEVYPVPGTITLLAGDGQHAPAGQRLAVPIRAQIVSRGGRPMAGVAVRLGAGDGTHRRARGRHVERRRHRAAAVDARRAARTPADRAGVDGDAGIATSLTADAEPVPENTRITFAGEPPRGRGRPGAAEPIVVRVTDSTGAPLRDVPVSWIHAGRRRDRGGLGARTDSLGEARARWTLGSRAGSQRA